MLECPSMCKGLLRLLPLLMWAIGLGFAVVSPASAADPTAIRDILDEPSVYHLRQVVLQEESGTFNPLILTSCRRARPVTAPISFIWKMRRRRSTSPSSASVAFRPSRIQTSKKEHRSNFRRPFKLPATAATT